MFALFVVTAGVKAALEWTDQTDVMMETPRMETGAVALVKLNLVGPVSEHLNQPPIWHFRFQLRCKLMFVPPAPINLDGSTRKATHARTMHPLACVILGPLQQILSHQEDA
jgi:hypothetical protein